MKVKGVFLDGAQEKYGETSRRIERDEIVLYTFFG
jgi:hypothetical protein